VRVYVYKEYLGPDGLPEVGNKLIRVFGSRSPSVWKHILVWSSPYSCVRTPQQSQVSTPIDFDVLVVLL